MLLTCQAGFESLFAREMVELHGKNVAETGPGWVRIDSEPPPPAPVAASPGDVDCAGLRAWVFAHLTLRDLTEVRGDSVNALAARVV
jgi:hypothetical protein